jgi:hypothetical protein
MPWSISGIYACIIQEGLKKIKETFVRIVVPRLTFEAGIFRCFAASSKLHGVCFKH